MIRVLVLASFLASVGLSGAALAADVPPSPASATPGSGVVVPGDPTVSPAGDAGMKPGVPKAPTSKHGFFFAAYASVWLALLGYVLYLATRVKALERR